MSKPLYLVAVDGSDWSKRAAERAIHLAQQAKAKVKLVSVLDWAYIQPMAMEGVIPELLDKEAEENNIIDNVLTPIIEKYKDLDVNITAELFWGDPTIVIKDIVKESHAVMLFVGRQGRSRIVDFLLGSVANKLAHSVGIPIVLVP
jgi:nucleotide-binding universal stress UspA family protein